MAFLSSFYRSTLVDGCSFYVLNIAYLAAGRKAFSRWREIFPPIPGKKVHIIRCDVIRSDIQLGKIDIYRNLGDGCRFRIQDLKTEAGRRDIPLTASARKSLIRQKEITLLLGKSSKLKEVDGISDFVFTNTQGTPYAANAVNFILKNIVNAYNKLEDINAANEHREPELLPHISAHILRHTACTRLAESGLEPKVLQYIMGHANLAVTMDIYTHLDFTQIQEKMEAVQERTRIG